MDYFSNLWCNVRQMSRGKSQIKSKKLSSESSSLGSAFVTKTRLNVNDLLQKREEEKAMDKKINLLIFSGVTAVAAVVLVILSL